VRVSARAGRPDPGPRRSIISVSAIPASHTTAGGGASTAPAADSLAAEAPCGNRRPSRRWAAQRITRQAAGIVIHDDRWWNATREDQAADRVHRIGQARGVPVLKLVTRGTLEEKIDAMIRRKAALMDALVAKGNALFKALSREALIDLLTGAP
jgi:hypothetical protein